ncbi:MAG: hypothetical protein GXY38_01100 [Planctomycetes bacterium]|jgi:hypothetical protein|nr:hypothetical protein [Planctomycetota bacterium]
MGFNPLEEKGTPIDKQFRNWQEMNVMPIDKESADPYTRTRVILMNGIEIEGQIFNRQFSRHCNDHELKKQLAATRRIEQQQQKHVNWLLSGEESTLEVTLGYEQVAVDLTAYLARTEPDPNVKAALDFALLEDFDHLYRYANLMEMLENKRPEKIVGDLTEIMPGRPTISEHIHPFDTLRMHYDRNTADILTKLHVLTIVSGEQQTMNYYMNVGPSFIEHIARGLYLEIAQIEEQHVSHYESLADPNESWFERLLLHEYNECYMYYSCLTSESDQRVRAVWQRNLEDEVEHLRIAADLLMKNEGRDARELLPDELPQLTIFQSNKAYVRQVLASQIDLTADETEYVPVSELPKDARFFRFQKMVNADGYVPSQAVIEEHIQNKGRDYRLETEGSHPVERLRDRNAAAA